VQLAIDQEPLSLCVPELRRHWLIVKQLTSPYGETKRKRSRFCKPEIYYSETGCCWARISQKQWKSELQIADHLRSYILVSSHALLERGTRHSNHETFLPRDTWQDVVTAKHWHSHSTNNLCSAMYEITLSAVRYLILLPRFKYELRFWRRAKHRGWGQFSEIGL
jgi:hypothetical protein